MNKTEVAKLLTMASAIDNRTVGVETVEAWFLVIGDLDFDDATTAMFSHFRSTTDYLTPRQIILGVESIERKRKFDARQAAVDAHFAMRDRVIELEWEKIRAGQADDTKLDALLRGEWMPEWSIDMSLESKSGENADPQVRIES